ncbi:GNAT family N-acetyltransferase [Nonomuraea typhae]|uniref:GNAT family N-acetyltransferase n=1 Tax=Nonomuraea typhae TaxID=2603600 RepID=UPI001C68326F|nr:GNAT family N-acetyltransferase [Nonomuraea typhae]
MLLTVAPATPEDGDVLGEIHAESWKVAYAPFFDPAFAEENVADRRTRWHARIGAGDDSILLGLADGRPLALSYFGPSQTRPGLAEIHGFYAHPDGWGSGISQTLMDATLARLKEAGYTRAHLWTLRDTPQSRRFYAKCGFTESDAVRDHDFGDGNPLAQVEFEIDL